MTGVMAEYTKVITSGTRRMAMVSMILVMELCIKGNGKIINSMVKGLFIWKMVER